MFIFFYNTIMELYNAYEHIIKTEIDNYVDFRLLLETIDVTHVREALLANLKYIFTNKRMCKVSDSQTSVNNLLAKRIKIEYYETSDSGKFYNMILYNYNLKKVRLMEHVFDCGMTIERKDVKCYFNVKTPQLMENLCNYYPVKRDNIFVKIFANEKNLMDYNQENISIYSLDLTVHNSDIIIPQKFNNLRSIVINCKINKNITITVDGFKKLEYLVVNNNNKEYVVTLNVLNVPYLLVSEIN